MFVRAVLWGLLGLAVTWVVDPIPAAPVEFNRDVRPILSEKCFACHGPDRGKRKAGLRLDDAESATKTLKSGAVAVVPGKPEESEVLLRIRSDDPHDRMPPPETGKTVSASEAALLERWIAEGAKFQAHWAYMPLVRPALPVGASGAAVRSEVDAFIGAKLLEQRLVPSGEADRTTLLRRLRLDLTGLPPRPEEVDAFAADEHPAALERAADRLLASPAFGERMALWWLDLARYADTVGYHGDQDQPVWPYRDWVIRAFNEDMPFDRFTVEQIAGDLLPEATVDQRVAAGYSRLAMKSAEGGVQDKEYLAKYAAERVRAVSGAWLGATLGCAECHDHKFDPYTTKDFYRFAAFWADVEERGIYGGAESTGAWGPRIELPSAEQAEKLRRLGEELAPHETVLSTQTPELDAEQARWEAALAAASTPAAGGGAAAPPADLSKIPEKLRAVLAVVPAQRSDTQRAELAAHFRSIAPSLESVRKRHAELKRERDEVQKQVPKMLTTTAVAPRTMRVLPRGNWMDDSGDVVTPGVPQFLPQLKLQGERTTRIDLGRWLVAAENPLTARTISNQVWKLFFGAGLSRRLDDLGSQGDWPSHPELIEWLACELRDSGWDLKHLVRRTVASTAYRRSSTAAREIVERDPFNRWLGRQGRFRLDAEMVRDTALAVSGLLSRRIGGPSSKPYQPPGYFAYLNFPVREWQNDSGEGQYRRGLYTHWQRQYLHPSLLAFDAPCREECVADRVRSNTPLQALTLLNDPSYVETARAFAERIVREGGAAAGERVAWALREALSRPPRPQEAEVLAGLYERHLEEYRREPGAAAALLGVGQRPGPSDIESAELAAWTSVARAILNLHEMITRS
jgi:hypothetical protein